MHDTPSRTHTHTHTYTHAGTQARTHTHTHTHTHAHTHARTHPHACTHAHRRMHTHTHTHTHSEMAFWTHRDTVTRSWSPLLCHSSTTITSCCSMIMHGPMLQGSVHNSLKLNTSQILHDQHTHWTYHTLSMFGMLWIGVYDSVFQFLPTSSNFAQPLKRSGPTFHRPQSTTWSTLCKGDVLQCVR